MALPKDIFDLFKENRDKVKERPSPQVWERLEQRLDQDQQPKVRRLRFTPLRIAAAIAVVVVAVFLLNQTFQTENMTMADAQTEKAVDGFQVIEDVAIATEVTIQGQAVQQQQQLRAVKFEEGQRSNRLIVGKLNQSPNNSALDPQVAVNVSPIESTPPEGEGVGQIVADLSEEAEEVPSNPTPIEDTTVVYIADSPRYQMTTETEKPGAVSYDADDESVKEAKTTAGNIPTYNSSKRKVEYYGDKLDPEVAKFQWILGQWKNTASYNPSFEEWNRVDPFTIEGQGYILVNGQKTFTEQMQIKKIGSELYFISALDESGQPIQFKLKTIANNQAVFENLAQDFPQQVILNQTDDNSFETIFQNQTPAEVPEVQETYFSNRNAVQSNQASRNMSRVNKE